MSSTNLRSEIYKTIGFTYRNYIITKRNFFTLFETLFWPIIGLISVGLMGAYLNLDKNYLAFILIGAVTLSVLQVSQLDVAYVLLFDMWSKSLRYTFVTPISIFNMIFGAWFFGAFRGLVAFLILVVSGKFLFDLNLLIDPVGLFIFLLGIFLSAMIIGTLTCSLLLIFGYRAEVSAWTLTAIFMLLCGIYYPVTLLPPGLREMAYAIPLTHFLEFYRSFYGFSPSTNNPALIGYSLSFLFLILLFLTLMWASDRARKRGTVTQFSE
ncbi:MAG: ABC transporter permease [Archaeoglobi archaeon]|jgi:ABC-2 type transport system permease protein|nr:MAG: ABC transporter permease [Archaeoglobi archaeon]TDA27905.1 MAG: ABC transporter permease [Archaeoglobi archaeon]